MLAFLGLDVLLAFVVVRDDDPEARVYEFILGGQFGMPRCARRFCLYVGVHGHGCPPGLTSTARDAGSLH